MVFFTLYQTINAPRAKIRIPIRAIKIYITDLDTDCRDAISKNAEKNKDPKKFNMQDVNIAQLLSPLKYPK